MMPSIFQYDSVQLSESGEFLVILDQSQLPGKELFLEIKDEHSLFGAILSLKVRGAPAIGVAAAYGVYVSLRNKLPLSVEQLRERGEEVISLLSSSRPTAVNLDYALNRMKKVLTGSHGEAITASELLNLLYKEAESIKCEDVAMCSEISRNGLTLLKPGMGILTHCNAGHLAVSRYGTALGPIYLAQSKGYGLRVFADETRPLLQGARLTAYELMKGGVDVTLICDNMASSVISKGWINAIMVGCDRIASNGDTANKIGTSQLAVIADYWKIPFYVLGPSSTIDPDCPDGGSIVVEQRDESEVTTKWYKERMAPEGVKVYNPAFDITSAELISAIITEKGIFRYPYNFKQ